MQNLPSIDLFELNPMMNDAEDVVETNRLPMIAIACLTIEELSLIGYTINNEYIMDRAK